jgi:hypothetical protein
MVATLAAAPQHELGRELLRCRTSNSLAILARATGGYVVAIGYTLVALVMMVVLMVGATIGLSKWLSITNMDTQRTLFVVLAVLGIVGLIAAQILWDRLPRLILYERGIRCRKHGRFYTFPFRDLASIQVGLPAPRRDMISATARLVGSGAVRAQDIQRETTVLFRHRNGPATTIKGFTLPFKPADLDRFWQQAHALMPGRITFAG